MMIWLVFEQEALSACHMGIDGSVNVLNLSHISLRDFFNRAL